jgi:hypothetical protein
VRVLRLLCQTVAGTALASLPACQGILDPYPEPLPANIAISAWPAPGSSLDAAAADSVVLQFDRSMDPESLRLVRRMSFLFPLTVEHFDGRWSPDHRRVVFDLTQFPVQPGTLYEAVFSGLRTAAGELYNLGPYRVWFRTRGRPDLFPMQMEEALSERPFCHRAHPDSTTCAATSTLHLESTGPDGIALRVECDECAGTEAHRRDLFREVDARVEWLGWDELDAAANPTRSVRWPQPPVLFAAPVRSGDLQVGTPQDAAGGTRLESWTSTVGKLDSPVHYVDAPGLPIQIVFSESRRLELDYVLVHPGGRREARRERWWLYPGIGLVQREIEITRDDPPGRSWELRSYAPTLSDD